MSGPVNAKQTIARLEKALSDECANSLRLVDRLRDIAAAWFDWDQTALDELLGEYRAPDPGALSVQPTEKESKR